MTTKPKGRGRGRPRCTSNICGRGRPRYTTNSSCGRGRLGYRSVDEGDPFFAREVGVGTLGDAFFFARGEHLYEEFGGALGAFFYLFSPDELGVLGLVILPAFGSEAPGAKVGGGDLKRVKDESGVPCFDGALGETVENIHKSKLDRGDVFYYRHRKHAVVAHLALAGLGLLVEITAGFVLHGYGAAERTVGFDMRASLHWIS